MRKEYFYLTLEESHVNGLTSKEAADFYLKNVKDFIEGYDLANWLKDALIKETSLEYYKPDDEHRIIVGEWWPMDNIFYKSDDDSYYFETSDAIVENDCSYIKEFVKDLHKFIKDFHLLDIIFYEYD